MGYILKNGKRYYVDANGKETLDNVSQEAADQRARRSAERSSNVFTGGRSPAAATPVRRISWGWMVFIFIGVMIVGAVLYNHTHRSAVAMAIEDYMDHVDSEETDDEISEGEEVSVAEEENTGAVQETSEYIIPDSDSRYMEASEIEGCSHDEIQMMINEIYARHGRIFKDQAIREYFESKSWYEGTVSPENFSDTVFNDFEKKNIALLSSYR